MPVHSVELGHLVLFNAEVQDTGQCADIYFDTHFNSLQFLVPPISLSLMYRHTPSSNLKRS